MLLIIHRFPKAIYQYNLAKGQLPAYCRVVKWNNLFEQKDIVKEYWIENKVKLDIDNDNDFHKFIKLRAFW